MRESPSKLWLLLIVVGMALRMTTLLYPVHEQMHAEMVGLTGGTVVSMTNNHITWIDGNATAILFFGYGGEVLLYALGALLFKRIGLGCYGVMLIAGLHAVGSTDFEKLGGGFLLLHLAIWLLLVVLIAWLTYVRYRVVEAPGEQKQSQPVEFRAQLHR